jgi:two-component system response regulator MprA
MAVNAYPKPKNQKKLVLAADDEPMILELLGMTMRAAGYRFIQASNGEGVLAKLAMGYEPDVIILDMGMPKMDGLKTCQKLRAEYPTLNAPVIFLTARKSMGDVADAKLVGGDDFIVKPFQTETVLKRVEHWINRRARGGGLQASGQKPVDKPAGEPAE